MIINVRGTSGSGKSTIVRKIMALAPARDKIFLKGTITVKRRPTPDDPRTERLYSRGKNVPLFYRLKWPGGPVISIPGHYETACGGCDTLPDYATLFKIVREEHACGHHVLFEGLLVAHDKKQCTALWEHLGKDPEAFTVLEIQLSLEDCLKSVEQRRAAAYAAEVERQSKKKKPTVPKPLSPFNPDNTVRRYGEVVRSCTQLEGVGIPVIRRGRAEAVKSIRRLLGIPAHEEAAA